MYHSRRSSRSGDEHLYTTAIDLDLNPNAYLDDEKGNASSSSNEDLPIARGLPSKWTNRREKHGAMSAKTKSILQVVLVVVGTVIGWTGNEWTRFLENGEGAGGSLNASNRTCNPYTQRGVLEVNQTYAPGNRWQPISSDCEPTDFMSELLARSDAPEMAFMANRTIMIYGDSVDRDHVEDLCRLADGHYAMIGVNHPSSPPYPLGTELPPADYVNVFDGTRTWPNFAQSRPNVCVFPHNNLRVLNVFHYGFKDTTGDSFISNHPHHYPPADINDRFDQIVIPILENVAHLPGYAPGSPIPDLLSISSGFWSLLRSVMADDALYAGDTAWKPMPQERRESIQRRMLETMRRVGGAWPPAKKDIGKLRKPKILWRALHHVKEQRTVPFHRLQTLDQVGRRVVELLVEEGQAAADQTRKSAAKWTAWMSRVKGWTNSKTILDETRMEALLHGFDKRLVVNHWGSLMLGQEHTGFKDNIHPQPLPGSYLYGNSLLLQLKIAVEDQKRADGK